MGIYEFNSRIISPNSYPFGYTYMYMLWTPEQIATDLWLDASDSDTITIDTGVSVWADKSGNSNDAVQATAGSQPSVVSFGLNGLDILRFNGSSSYLEHPVVNTTPEDLNIFAISKFAGGVSNSGVLWGHRFEVTRLIQVTYQSSTEFLLQLRSNTSSLLSVSKTISADSWINTNIKFSMTESSHNVWVDGVSSTENTTTFSGQNFGSNKELIGATFTSEVGFFFNGDIAEIIIINGAVIDDTRRKIEGYLAHKWGLVANLPSSHPYKASAP